VEAQAAAAAAVVAAVSDHGIPPRCSLLMEHLIGHYRVISIAVFQWSFAAGALAAAAATPPPPAMGTVVAVVA